MVRMIRTARFIMAQMAGISFIPVVIAFFMVR